jgi:hypothetical protein
LYQSSILDVLFPSWIIGIYHASGDIAGYMASPMDKAFVWGSHDFDDMRKHLESVLMSCGKQDFTEDISWRHFLWLLR